MDLDAATDQGTRLRIFIAEDSVNVQIALRSLVDVIPGARVVAVAASEAVALDWARRHKDSWDVAIVDLILDQGAGFNVIRRLKAENPEGRVVVFSAFATEAIHAHCLALGADLVLRKENSSELAQHLEALAADAPGSQI